MENVFHAAFISAMNSLGENIPYYYVLGVSGVAFRCTVTPGEWEFSNYGIQSVTPAPYEPIRRVAEEVPDFQPELSLAVEKYGEMKRLRDSMDDLIGDNFSEKATQAIHDPEIRRKYADTILRIRDVEGEAVTHIERLLARCG